jgi:hypothetical protein
MTPTRYPGWRFFGILAGLFNAFLIYGAVALYYGEPTAIRSVGWMTSDGYSPYYEPKDTHFYTFVFSMTITAMGAVLSIKRPAMGFWLFGTGYLTSAVCILILFRAQQDLPMVLGCVAVGVWYSRLGAKQLELDLG